jgi:hypothetical protein
VIVVYAFPKLSEGNHTMCDIGALVTKWTPGTPTHLVRRSYLM